jgi:hypothetical protein
VEGLLGRLTEGAGVGVIFSWLPLGVEEGAGVGAIFSWLPLEKTEAGLGGTEVLAAAYVADFLRFGWKREVVATFTVGVGVAEEVGETGTAEFGVGFEEIGFDVEFAGVEFAGVEFSDRLFAGGVEEVTEFVGVGLAAGFVGVVIGCLVDELLEVGEGKE